MSANQGEKIMLYRFLSSRTYESLTTCFAAPVRIAGYSCKEKCGKILLVHQIQEESMAFLWQAVYTTETPRKPFQACDKVLYHLEILVHDDDALQRQR